MTRPIAREFGNERNSDGNCCRQNAGRVVLPSTLGCTVTFWFFFSSGSVTITSAPSTLTLTGLSR
jgi:hypothetical protein